MFVEYTTQSGQSRPACLLSDLNLNEISTNSQGTLDWPIQVAVLARPTDQLTPTPRGSVQSGGGDGGTLVWQEVTASYGTGPGQWHFEEEGPLYQVKNQVIGTIMKSDAMATQQQTAKAAAAGR